MLNFSKENHINWKSCCTSTASCDISGTRIIYITFLHEFQTCCLPTIPFFFPDSTLHTVLALPRSCQVHITHQPHPCEHQMIVITLWTATTPFSTTALWFQRLVGAQSCSVSCNFSCHAAQMFGQCTVSAFYKKYYWTENNGHRLSREAFSLDKMPSSAGQSVKISLWAVAGLCWCVSSYC